MMKKIFMIFVALLMVSASQSAKAQGIVLGLQRDTTKLVRKPGKLIQVNRVDRS